MGLLAKLFGKKEPPIQPASSSVECWQACPEMPVPEMMSLIMRSPPCSWPGRHPRHGHWWEWPNVHESHRQLMRRFVDSLRPYPDGQYRGRGICIAAGGWRFYPSVFVTVKMIRDAGCSLPIELFFLGVLNEFEPKMEWLLRDYGPITWRDANSVAKESGMEPRYLGTAISDLPPWEVKLLGALCSSFEHVLSMDADSYPIRPFEDLFDHKEYRKTGAVFWPDGMGQPPDSVWHHFGLGQPRKPAVESGQFLINKRKCWTALNLAWWLNDHRDYTYRIPGLYGDKDTLPIAWEFTKTPYSFPWTRPGRVNDSYLQPGFDGKTTFIHRTHCKIVLDAKTYFKSRTGATRYSNMLPKEDKVQAWVKELDLLLNPRKQFRIRDNTVDQQVWDEVVTSNAYRLPKRMDGQVIIDVGANIGAFSYAALSRGAAFVYAVEPMASNVMSYQRNLRPWKDRLRLFMGAAANERNRSLVMTRLTRGGMEAQYAMAGIDYEGDRQQADVVSTVRFDTLVKHAWKRHQQPVTVKMDCEGGEYACLCFSKHLDKVQSIYGEFHRIQWHGREWGPDDLRAALEPAGFKVTFAAEDAQNAGFWATRI